MFVVGSSLDSAGARGIPDGVTPAPNNAAPKPPAPSGLICLSLIAGQLQRPTDPIQLTQSLGLNPTQAVTEDQILLAAKRIGLKARGANLGLEKLSRLPAPAMALCKDGEYVLLIRREPDGTVLIGDPFQPRPQRLSADEFQQRWSGRIILVRVRLEFDNPNRPFDLFWFIPALWKFRKPLATVLVAALLIQLVGLVTPLFTQVIIDKVLSHKSLPTLYVMASGMLIAILFEAILSVQRAWLMAHTSNRLDTLLGLRVFQHLLHLPLRYFELRRVGDSVARVRELENIRQFLTGPALTAILDVPFTVIFVAVMLVYSGALTAVALAAVPLFVALSLVVRPLMRHRLDDRFDRGAQMQSFLVESVTGIQTVKAMALEPSFSQNWQLQLARYCGASYQVAQLSGLSGALGQAIQKFSTLAILWVGAYLVMSSKLTVGQLIAFQMLSGRVLAPLLRVVQLWQDFQQVGLSVKRLGDLLNTRPEPVLSPGKMTLPPIQGAVKLDGVRYRYNPDGPEILRGLSFDIKSGATVGVVGRSGSGKSTLTKLLQRLYNPELGRVLIDGIDLRNVDALWLRRQIGVVLQDNLLFNGSIRDNIAQASPGANMQQVVAAARLAGAHEFILELPDGYDTPVGERGASLSGGQRQRIAIARALIPNPRILIFDEATSALDYESERIIQDNLKSICQGRTVFIIAHRLSTLQHADTILVLDHGELVEQGNHTQLMARQGLYHHLFSQQTRGEPKGAAHGA